MPEKTQAEITYSQLEYTSTFEKPILQALSPPSGLIAAVLDALKAWGYKLDGVEANSQVLKLNEYSIVFRRTTPAFPPRSLTLGLGKAIVTAENIDWTEAGQFIAELSAALGAIHDVGGAEIQSHHLAVGMHIQLKDRPRNDVTAPLVSPVADGILDGKTDFSGVILLRGKAIVVIDASVGIANGLFVRISREHPPETSLEKIAETLRIDEQRIFDVLGLEGIL